MDRKLRTSLADFAVRFCNEMKKDENSICSPLSCEMVLALTALGCTGDSRTELLKALKLPDDAAIRSTFAAVSKMLQSVKGVTLRLANRVYVTNNGALKPSIKKDAKDVFESGLEQLDFTESDAADIINRWVAKQTSDKIQQVFLPGSFGGNTKLVLVNAIYFQGSWELPFSKRRTVRNEFHVNNATTIVVPTMTMGSYFPKKDGPKFHYMHSSRLKAKLLQMYYKDRQASMIFVLPDEIEGLEHLLQKLVSGYDLMKKIKSIKHRTQVRIEIPKFKIESHIDLKNLLRKMGIKAIFDAAKADINMLQSDETLVVSSAVQKAIIEVDENGTEAAACTVLEAIKLCGRRNVPEPNPAFQADHPFLYILESQHVPLFLGVYRGCPSPEDAELALLEDDSENGATNQT